MSEMRPNLPQGGPQRGTVTRNMSLPPVTADHTPERPSVRAEIHRLLLVNVRDDGYLSRTDTHDAVADRMTRFLLAALRAECDVLREQTAQVEALVAGDDFDPQPWVRKADVRALLHHQNPDQERTSG